MESRKADRKEEGSLARLNRTDRSLSVEEAGRQTERRSGGFGRVDAWFGLANWDRGRNG